MGKDNPDWRKPADYPDPKTATPLQWAWEFFRRNPAYRKVGSKIAHFLSQTAVIENGRSPACQAGELDFNAVNSGELKPCYIGRRSAFTRFV